MRMMQVFVLKFKTVSKLQLPVLMSRHKSASSVSSTASSTTPTQDGDTVKTEENKQSILSATNPQSPDEFRDADEKKLKFSFPPSQAANYSVADCRALVKTLVCGVKTITWGCTSCKTDAAAAVPGQAIQVCFKNLVLVIFDAKSEYPKRNRGTLENKLHSPIVIEFGVGFSL